jgi:hypothetical protein
LFLIGFWLQKLEDDVVFYFELIVDRSIAIYGILVAVEERLFPDRSTVHFSIYLTPKLGRFPELLLTKGFSRIKLT